MAKKPFPPKNDHDDDDDMPKKGKSPKNDHDDDDRPKKAPAKKGKKPCGHPMGEKCSHDKKK